MPPVERNKNDHRLDNIIDSCVNRLRAMRVAVVSALEDRKQSYQQCVNKSE